MKDSLFDHHVASHNIFVLNRNPINIVIGAPIPCPHLTDMDAQETRDAVNRIHAQYMQVRNTDFCNRVLM